jgi:hypothetical protein
MLILSTAIELPGVWLVMMLFGGSIWGIAVAVASIGLPRSAGTRAGSTALEAKLTGCRSPHCHAPADSGRAAIAVTRCQARVLH